MPEYLISCSFTFTIEAPDEDDALAIADDWAVDAAADGLEYPCPISVDAVEELEDEHED